MICVDINMVNIDVDVVNIDIDGIYRFLVDNKIHIRIKDIMEIIIYTITHM